MNENPKDPLTEISAMQRLVEALAGLDRDAIARVLRWATERYEVTCQRALPARHAAAPNDVLQTETPVGESSRPPRFEHFADLYNAASPSTDSDRALVGGYWTQYCLGETDFVAQGINAALKDLGHQVSNITGAFDSLKAKRPALVLQVKKSGSTRQARKKYKLTAAGKTAVEDMIEHH